MSKFRALGSLECFLIDRIPKILILLPFTACRHLVEIKVIKINLICYILKKVNFLAYYLFQEFFSVKNDAALFLFGSHSKKRPHNLVLGTVYAVLFFLYNS